jgi:hypothetical protein
MTDRRVTASVWGQACLCEQRMETRRASGGLRLARGRLRPLSCLHASDEAAEGVEERRGVEGRAL